MKITIPLKIVFLCIATVFYSCTKDDITVSEQFENTLSYDDTSAQHPKNEKYKTLIADYVQKGIVGTSVYIRDDFGTWIGTGGMANLDSAIEVENSHQFMIASVSKVFTATLIYSLIDNNVLAIDDPIEKWLSQEVVNNVANAKEATIEYLLSHTSGIPDYYTVAFELARFNIDYNYWSQEEILKYIYGKNAVSSVGSGYAYSNTNYLLLGMIIEKATGIPLKEAYSNYIFEPLNLKNAFFDVKENAAPPTLINGYYNLFGNGYVHSDFLYKDELSTGDGGIVINAQDLGTFLDALMHGQLISDESLDKMQDWFDIESGGKNGYGLEYFSDDFGVSYGHSGGVDGFTSVAHYYPVENVTVIILFNFTPADKLSDTLFEFINKIKNEAIE